MRKAVDVTLVLLSRLVLVANTAVGLGATLFYLIYTIAPSRRLVSNANAIALGLLPVWIYYTAAVFLIGGEVAETYDHMRRPREQRAILT